LVGYPFWNLLTAKQQKHWVRLRFWYAT